jgi:sulfotransferase family protein
MDAPVDVLDVSLSVSGTELLAGFGVDAPTAGGDASDGANYALDVRGWVVGRDSPVVAIELHHDGARLWRVPLHERPDIASNAGMDAPALCGFYATINTLRLPRDFTIAVHAVFTDDSQVEFATISGRRPALHSRFEPRLAPLMVTTLGRTGSTILVRLLEAHPEVVAYPPFEAEPKVASYWIDVLLALSEPASYRRQLTPGRDLNSTWWLGSQMPMPRARWPRPLHESIGATAIETLAGFCQERIEALYEEIASEYGVREPRYFAEKYWATSTIPGFMWELYANPREVFVVRDFRDMACSMKAFDAKRGFQAFGRQRVQNEEHHIVEQLAPRVASLHREWRRRADRAHLVRYEDLVAEPTETVSAMLSYLAIDSAPDTLESVTRAMTERVPGMDEHRTAPDAEASIGRWRREMDPELQRVSESAFGPALEAFGYA